MALINIFLIIVFVAIGAILFAGTKGKGIVVLIALITNALLSSFIAARALMGHAFEMVLTGTASFGAVPVSIDALSGWFILTINFTIITGGIYGFHYMRQYINQKSNITLHC